MSQRLVYQILQEIGHPATLAEIKEMARIKHPGSLHTYVGSRLKKLKMWGYVEYIKEKKDKKGYYVVKDPFPDTRVT